LDLITRAGHRIAFRQQGEGGPLLILPGQTSSSAHHSGELAFFAQHYRAVAPDFWGTGQSDRLERWPDNWWEQAAHDMADLLGHMEQDRCIAIGTSGGGIVALLLAILYPERVSAVVADSCVDYHPPEVLRRAVDERRQHSPDQIGFWQHAHGSDWTQVVQADDDLLLRVADRGGRNPLYGRLDQVRCPVLLTASLHDPLLPHAGQQIAAMAQEIPDCRVFLSNQGDHPLMWSRPGDFRRIVRCFLQEILPRPPKAQSP
jgi:valacyclovir hydrolase